MSIVRIKKKKSISPKGLRVEKSENCSGVLDERIIQIPQLKEEDYFVKDIELDGDAPKQFIKAYFYKEDSGVKKEKPNSWSQYIAKTAEKWYPHESVVEYMINRIGQELGLRMNEIEMVQANGQIRFLSKYFRNEDERLIHGAEICGEHLGDLEMAKQIAEHRGTSRELFTFEFIRDAIRSVFPNCCENLLLDLVKMVAFDALVGNNDRHFYNWGVMGTKKKTKRIPTFAPLYDSARGLLWNWSDENIVKHYRDHLNRGRKVVNYIEQASPRISIEEDYGVNHFQLIAFIKGLNKVYRETVDQLASEINEQKILNMLKEEFYPLFIAERCELITLIIKTRFKKVRSI
jgi:hypothetical protein